MEVVREALKSIEDTFEGIYSSDSNVFAQVDLGLYAKKLGYNASFDAYVGVKVYVPVDLDKQNGIECPSCEFNNHSPLYSSQIIIPSSLCMALGEDICECKSEERVFKYIMEH